MAAKRTDSNRLAPVDLSGIVEHSPDREESLGVRVTKIRFTTRLDSEFEFGRDFHLVVRMQAVGSVRLEGFGLRAQWYDAEDLLIRQETHDVSVRNDPSQADWKYQWSGPCDSMLPSRVELTVVAPPVDGLFGQVPGAECRVEVTCDDTRLEAVNPRGTVYAQPWAVDVAVFIDLRPAPPSPVERWGASVDEHAIFGPWSAVPLPGDHVVQVVWIGADGHALASVAETIGAGYPVPRVCRYQHTFEPKDCFDHVRMNVSAVAELDASMGTTDT